MAILHLVHCIDTEGPLCESLQDTFERIRSVYGVDIPPSVGNLEKLQNKEINLGDLTAPIARMVGKKLLAYNCSWVEISSMLEEAMSNAFRNRHVDDFGKGWVYSWHCMDHMNYTDNPRRKDVGYGNIFRFYLNMINKTESLNDEINWHFHPLSITKNPLHAATSYSNSYQLINEILCRRIIEDRWFPVVNRPGFHSERPDSHLFLEQWIPFDYANQAHHGGNDQVDLNAGRFGDWRRAPLTWRGYHPSHDDYQKEGGCRRLIFRCLNVGTRLRLVEDQNVVEALEEACKYGEAVLAFANHDYRDIRPDVEFIYNLVRKHQKQYPHVSIKNSTAHTAARSVRGFSEMLAPKLSIEITNNNLTVKSTEGKIFGPQPFLAIKDKTGKYYHDNFDFQIPDFSWSYTFDEQTIPLEAVSDIGVGAAGLHGFYDVKVITLINSNGKL